MATLSTGKRVLFSVILALVAYALAEAASVAVHYFARQEIFSFAKARAARQAIAGATDATKAREFGAMPVGDPPGSIYEVLHPYLGYVHDPTTAAYPHSDFGFPDVEVRPYPKDPNRLVIAIFGGSFADGLSRTTKELMTDQLRRSPRLAGKEIRILTVAMGGYKQPQQLLSLAYLLSLGAHFDIVVNLDGFNEVALPAFHNVPAGVFPFFPLNWSGRMGAFDATMLAFARRHAALFDDRKAAARLASRAPFRFSVTANVAWMAYDRFLDGKLKEVNLAGLNYRPAEKAATYTVRGPGYSFANQDALYDDLAAMWKTASLQMKSLAAANGIAYLHFLQPNQYVERSKDMGAEERRIAYEENHPYRNSVVVGYPKLIARGKELRKEGVLFFDLTASLASHPEPLYADSCCHLTTQGYSVIASRIVEEILKVGMR